METDTTSTRQIDKQKIPDGVLAKTISEKRTGRIEKLREYILGVMPEISSERVRYYTEAYREHEADPIVVKRAKALRRMLGNMSIYILEGELLVGSTCMFPRGVELFPEFEVEWIERELDNDPYSFDKRPGDRFLIKDTARKELKETLPWWHGKTHCEHVMTLLPEKTKNAWDMMVTNSYWLMQGGDGHITVNYKMILNKGLRHLITEIKDKLAELDFSSPDFVSKHSFYSAALISLEAAAAYARRYSQYAKELASNEKDQERKRELE